MENLSNVNISVLPKLICIFTKIQNPEEVLRNIVKMIVNDPKQINRQGFLKHFR